MVDDRDLAILKLTAEVTMLRRFVAHLFNEIIPPTDVAKIIESLDVPPAEENPTISQVLEIAKDQLAEAISTDRARFSSLRNRS